MDEIINFKNKVLEELDDKNDCLMINDTVFWCSWLLLCERLVRHGYLNVEEKLESNNIEIDNLIREAKHCLFKARIKLMKKYDINYDMIEKIMDGLR